MRTGDSRTLLRSTAFGLIILCCLIGCAQHNYKKEADEQVYHIIDQKWHEDFGTKVNYKISDTDPSPNDIQLEREVADFGVLTLPQAVALATAHNREYQTQKEALYIMALDLQLTRHGFEKRFFGRPRGSYAKAASEGFVSGGAGIESRIDPDRLGHDLPAEIDYPEGRVRGEELRMVDGFGFDQLLSTGTSITMNVGLAWGRITTGLLKGEALLSVLSAEVAQPLLRGRDRKVVLENLTQTERDTLYQVRSFNRFRKMFVVSVISQYYWVLQRRDLMKNARENYNALTWLCERVEKLANAGRVPLLELDRVQQDKLQALTTYSQAEKEYEQALDEFKITLSLPATTEFHLDEAEFRGLAKLSMAKTDFSEAEVIETTLCLRLDLANSLDAVIDAQRKVLVTADGLGAELNLRANTNVLLHDLTPDTKDLDDFFMAALELDLPLDRVAEQNVYRKALITLNQRQREYDLAADTVTLEVRQAHRDLTEAAERYEVLSEALELAERRFNNTFLLLQYGRASSRRVLRAHNDLFDAQNAASQALVDYTVATLNFYRDTGVLQVRPDGMWEL